MKLSISVMGHPSRQEFFPYIRKKLGDVPFSIDDTGIGLWANSKRAWGMFDPTADYHVVIQDDAIICDNFKEQAEKFISKKHNIIKTRAFSFYHSNRSLGIVKSHISVGYVIRKQLIGGVAVCLPTKLIPDMIKHCELYEGNDDKRIERYLQLKRIKIIYPLPCLIDHRSDIPSILFDGLIEKRRHAVCFAEGR